MTGFASYVPVANLTEVRTLLDEAGWAAKEKSRTTYALSKICDNVLVYKPRNIA